MPGPSAPSSECPCPLVEGPSAAGLSPVPRPMHLCLGHSRSPQQLPRSGQAQLRALRPSRSCLARPPNPQGPKKQVVFADTKGLSLTSVHMFEDPVGGDSEEGSCPPGHPPSLRSLAPPPSPCAPGLPAPGRDSGFPGTPEDPERVPRTERGARELPARHTAGASSGFPEGHAGAHHL